MTAARWLSIVFYQFVMVGVMVGTAAAARQTAVCAAALGTLIGAGGGAIHFL